MKRLWNRFLAIPFRNLAVVVLFLFLVGEWYPFSAFPMYANFDDEALVLSVADQNDRQLPMRQLSYLTSSNAKKSYKTRLKRVCEKQGMDVGDAGEEQKGEAARWVLEEFLRMKRTKGNPFVGVEALRLRLTRISMEEGKIRRDRQTLAQLALPQAPAP